LIGSSRGPNFTPTGLSVVHSDREDRRAVGSSEVPTSATSNGTADQIHGLKARCANHAGVASVRQGKMFEIELDASDEATARRLLEELCDKLLANPVIEDHSIVRLEA
jgi:phosphoribosylformylglycinamidine synthase PurS subunit